jgi:glucosamine kinase
MTDAVLAVDLGKTGCRAALWVGDTRAESEGAGAPGLATPGGAAAAETAALAVARGLLQAAGVARVNHVCIGAAGALAAPDAAARLAERLAAVLRADEAAATSDAVASHAGALGGGAGVVLAIGTGSVALALGAGRLGRADGWGPLLGDEGSGGWIGLRGLRAALRAAEGREPETALRAAVEPMFGPLPGLPAAIAGVKEAARFAPEVARVAEAGDAAAQAILGEAAERLTATARSAASALPPNADCAVVGGLARLGPVLMDRLGRLLVEAGLRLAPAQGTALDGAHLLALRPDLPHETHVVRRHAVAPRPRIR